MTDHVSKPVRPALLYALLDRIAEGTPMAETAPDDEPAVGPAAATSGSAPEPIQTHRDGDTEIEIDKMLELRRAVGAPVFTNLVNRFFENAEKRLKDFDATVRASDVERLKGDAHAMVGLFSQFGMSGAARVASEVELAPDAATRLALAPRLVAAGSDGLIRLREELSQIGERAS